MDIAIVTGAETPLGLNLIQRLVRQGYRVHGIGNNFSKITYSDAQFAAHPVDLSQLAEVVKVMQRILAKEKSLNLLVHAIDVTPGAAFEKLPVGNLEAILKVGLLGPVMLTRLAMPNLLRFRGQLINVIPANKSGHPASAVNALIEGGLREMNRALFDQARDAGLRVTNLILRQNPQPDGLEVKSSEQTHIDLEDVARSLEQLIDPNLVNVPSEIVLHPRASAQSAHELPGLPEPMDPYNEVFLPPREYSPPEQPKIPTQEKQKVERTIPYTDDEMEDKIAAAIEDFEAHPERYEQKEPPVERSKQQDARPEHTDASEDGAGSNKRRRGRRRGGRNRNRDRVSGESQPPTSQSDGQRSNDQSPKASVTKPVQQVEAMPKRSRRDDSGANEPKKDGPAQSKRKPPRKVETLAMQPTDAVKPKKAPTRKTPGKTVKKTAKTPAKKAAKKAAKKTPAKKAAKKTAKKKIVQASQPVPSQSSD